MVVAVIALVVALGGSVYAASRIDGHAVRVKSLPGNRLVPRSLPANRLRPGTIPGDRLEAGSVTGRQIDAATLGQVPEAAHAASADEARHAQTALVAGSAGEATHLNGHSAACGAGTEAFAGTCWESEFGEAAMTAPAAAAACAARGGELPAPLALAAFGSGGGVTIAAGGEWTNDVTNVSGAGKYAVVIVSPGPIVDSALSTATSKFRCVIPLVS
ncbi:MAG TPA: hypothetical protein VMT37_02250 [Solirubrobacterales bacterium]|nr:hypothetical protein [Solirubrobacterales bacterium]